MLEFKISSSIVLSLPLNDSFSRVRVVRLLVFCVVFSDRCLSFWLFSLVHCMFCSCLIYGFSLSSLVSSNFSFHLSLICTPWQSSSVNFCELYSCANMDSCARSHLLYFESETIISILSYVTQQYFIVVIVYTVELMQSDT